MTFLCKVSFLSIMRGVHRIPSKSGISGIGNEPNSLKNLKSWGWKIADTTTPHPLLGREDGPA